MKIKQLVALFTEKNRDETHKVERYLYNYLDFV